MSRHFKLLVIVVALALPAERWNRMPPIDDGPARIVSGPEYSIDAEFIIQTLGGAGLGRFRLWEDAEVLGNKISARLGRFWWHAFLYVGSPVYSSGGWI
jgi:hypothetical protein